MLRLPRVCWLIGLIASQAFAAPPKVIKAAPDNGDAGVDPGLKVIRIEFDQDMNPGGHSFCGGGPTFPEIAGKLRWSGKRVILVPVRLKPNQEYSFSVNCPAAQNFRSAAGEPAEAYQIAFRTGEKGGKGAARLTREANQKAFAKLREAIEERYSYRDLRKVDWDGQFEKYERKLLSAESAAAFARAAGEMLEPAKDIHVTLEAGTTRIATFRRTIAPNWNIEQLRRMVPDFEMKNEFVGTGMFDDGVGFLLIKSWECRGPDDLAPAVKFLDELKPDQALVIDVRPNAGGDELAARSIAARFVPKASVYSKHVTRDAKKTGGFSEPFERIIKPKSGHARLAGKVGVLMGPANMSSCESFLLMMRQDPECKLIGERSYGSSGNPKRHDLGNGVAVYLPSWKDMLPDGSPLEGVGIKPDIEVKADEGALRNEDPVLEAALEFVRGK